MKLPYNQEKREIVGLLVDYNESYEPPFNGAEDYKFLTVGPAIYDITPEAPFEALKIGDSFTGGRYHEGEFIETYDLTVLSMDMQESYQDEIRQVYETYIERNPFYGDLELEEALELDQDLENYNIGKVLVNIKVKDSATFPQWNVVDVKWDPDFSNYADTAEIATDQIVNITENEEQRGYRSESSPEISFYIPGEETDQAIYVLIPKDAPSNSYPSVLAMGDPLTERFTINLLEMYP